MNSGSKKRSYERILDKLEFLNLATVDAKGQPSVTPKFLLKHEKPHLYLVDSSYGRTTDNLRKNPKASVSFMDHENLEGFRLNGPAALLESGPEFKRLAEEVHRKAVRLSADRVLEGMRGNKKSSHFELEIPDRFVVIRFKVVEATRVEMSGKFCRE